LNTIKKIEDIIKLIDESIKEDSDLLLTWWNIIKNWYDKIVDDYRVILQNSWDWLAKYQSELIEKTWIWWFCFKTNFSKFIKIYNFKIKGIWTKVFRSSK